MRVGANSPSLWPTMFSVMYTGMNFFPLCTASVWLTISGTTVDRRDQVLMTFFSLARFITSTFSRRWVSTKGPFLRDLLMVESVAGATSHLFLAPLHDELIRRLAVARLVALGRQPPRRHRMPAARGFAFAAAKRMIDRVHRHAAGMGTLVEPPAASGFANRHVLVIEVADLSDRREALDV